MSAAPAARTVPNFFGSCFQRLSERKVLKKRLLFLKKRKQKDFFNLCVASRLGAISCTGSAGVANLAPGRHPRINSKSLFASFSSEKEDSFSIDTPRTDTRA